MPFFSQFPQKDITLENLKTDSATGNITLEIQKKKMVDIFRHVDVTTLNTNEYTGYTFYDIQDGERPDTVSYKLYGSTEYYWTFFIINDFLQGGSNNWYKGQTDFNRGIELEFDSLSAHVVVPNYTGTTGTDLNPLYGRSSNNLNGIDFSADWLRLIKLGLTAFPNTSNLDYRQHSFKPVKWDAERLTLTTEYLGHYNGAVSTHTLQPRGTIINMDGSNVSNEVEAFASQSSPDIRNIWFYDLSLGTQAQRDEWLASYQANFIQQNPQPQVNGEQNPVFSTQLDIANTSSNQFRGLIEGNPTSAYAYEFFSTGDTGSSSSRTYQRLKNAPYSFQANISVDREGAIDRGSILKGETISAWEALGRGHGSLDNTTTWYQHESDENEKNRRIVIIKPDLINFFVDEYKALIQS